MKKSVFVILLVSIFTVLPATITLAAQGDIYRLTGVAPDEGEVMRTDASSSSAAVIKIPHNASWIVKRKSAAGADGWQKVSWNDQHGWIQDGKLTFDRGATEVVKERNQCLNDPTVSNKMCCGFPPGAESKIFRSVKVHSVTGIPKGESLELKADPEKDSRTVVLIPHNATWVVKLGKQEHIGSADWEKVTWGGNKGWVDTLNLQFNPELTTAADFKRKQCSTPAGCAPDFSALDKEKK